MKSNNKNQQLISMEDYKLKKMIYEKGHFLREFPDRYEYCFVRNYENLYDNFQLDSIEIAQTFVQLLTIKDKILLVSMDFPKEHFDISIIIEYLDFYGIKLMGVNEEYLAYACDMYDAVLFRGHPLVFYERGNYDIKIDRSELKEVTEDYIHSTQKIDTYNLKERDSTSNHMKIVLDGEEIDYIPEIEIKSSKSIIISNGHIMEANYIGNYCDKIGFFKKKGNNLPISLIYDMDTTIYIDIFNQENQEIINIQHNYSIDIESLLKKRSQ